LVSGAGFALHELQLAAWRETGQCEHEIKRLGQGLK
jgi:hypothetical protein